VVELIAEKIPSNNLNFYLINFSKERIAIINKT